MCTFLCQLPIGNVTSAAANKPFKTPKYSFDGVIENADTTNKRMGPPPAPSWPSRKRYNIKGINIIGTLINRFRNRLENADV